MNPVSEFVEKARGLTKNPLGIIALFISLIYGFACLVLSTSISNLETDYERLPLIWFIIGFPIVILIAFIFLVIKHHEKLYAPADYNDSEAFLKTFVSKKQYQEVKVTVTNENIADRSDLTSTILKSENPDFNNVLFSPNGKDNLKIANDTFTAMRDEISDIHRKNLITTWGFGVQAPEYYVYEFDFNKDVLKTGKSYREIIIMRVTKSIKGHYDIIGIGKGIIEQTPEEFAKELKGYLINSLKARLKENELEKIK